MCEALLYWRLSGGKQTNKKKVAILNEMNLESCDRPFRQFNVLIYHNSRSKNNRNALMTRPALNVALPLRQKRMRKLFDLGHCQKYVLIGAFGVR